MSWLDLFCACLEDLAHPLGFPHLRKASLHQYSLEKELATPLATCAEDSRRRLHSQTSHSRLESPAFPGTAPANRGSVAR